MGVFAGPEIAESGLVLALDAGNSKGFDDDENLLTYSEQFDDASWGKGNGTISTNLITAPDETLTADAFIENTTLNAYHFLNKSITKSASSITYTFSIFVKSKGGRRVGLRIESGGAGVISEFNVVAGTITVAAATYNSGFSSVSSTIVNYPNDWYRITLTATSNTSTSLFVQLYLVSNVTNSSVYTGDGVSGIHILGGQLETSSSASPYYPTTGTAKNRGTTWTDLSGNGNNGTLTNGPTYSSANGGSLVFDGSNDHAVLDSGFQVSTSSTYSFEAWIYKTATNTSNAAMLISGGYGGDRDGIQIATEVYGSTDDIRISSEYGTVTAVYYNGVSQILNGDSTGTDTNFNLNEWLHIVVTGITVNSTDGAAHHIGQNNNNTNVYTGRISNLKVYDRTLTASEVQQNFIATRSRFGI